MAFRYVPHFVIKFLIERIFDKEHDKEEKIVLLKWSTGVMSIQQELEVSQYTLGEYALVVQMGRLNCSTSNYSLRVSIEGPSQTSSGGNSVRLSNTT
jgi:hypothetical protein